MRRTTDHSYVQMLVKRGEITEEQANVHPQSNILMGCLGTETEPPVDIHFIPRLRAGDVLVACSDGVWHYFNDDEMADVLDRLSAREAAESLIDAARGRAQGMRRQPVAGGGQARTTRHLSSCRKPVLRVRAPAVSSARSSWRSRTSLALGVVDQYFLTPQVGHELALGRRLSSRQSLTANVW